MDLIAALHALAVCALALHAAYHATLLFLLLRAPRAASAPSSRLQANTFPSVTVQVPLYNERAVVERILCAVAAQEYPRDRFRIQVLDDSDDETRTLARQLAAQLRAQGVRVELIQRSVRTGFKAGALAEGLQHTDDEFLAIFDADFVPPPDFLRRVLVEEAVFADTRVGFVQTRWAFLNAEGSLVTHAQALMLDVHFEIEQRARASVGLPISFNGSAGVWRRACILDAGGWQADTLTEDLDLGYRAQLRGWRGVYLPQVAVPSELPADVLSYKRQQARWARGTAQVLRKMLPQITRSALPWWHRLAVLFHLAGYFVHVWVALTAFTAPLLMWRWVSGQDVALPAWLGVMSTLCAVPLVSFVVAQRMQGKPWGATLRALPFALMLGVGVSLSNTVALTSALFDGRTGVFDRTPKRGALRRSPYAPQRADWTALVELALAGYTAWAAALALRRADWFAALPLVLYALGFGAVAADQLRSLAMSKMGER